MVSSSDLNQAVIELDLFSLPLTGRSLIEASAGTGKTYSLAFIYLRLLLGIGDNSYTRPLLVDEILVVTFTKAATEELRYRIGQNIQQLRIGCIQGYHSDTNYQQLLNLIDDKESAAKRLLQAQQSMDEAAIFTIHSFCQRMLTRYAFESGSLFQKVLVKDESHLYLQVVRDFWREYFTPMPEDIAQVIWQNWADPQALLADIYPYLNRELPDNIHVSSIPLLQHIATFHQQTIAKIDLVKSHWLAAANIIAQTITQSDVNKRSYSKSNLPRWIERVTQWAKLPTKDYAIPNNELSKFSQAELNRKTEVDKIAPTNNLFNEIEQLLATSLSLHDAILFDIVTIISQKIQQQKAILAQTGFNDLLNDLRLALQGDNGLFLADQILAQYPVAMIDEFQDTDSIQYQVFNAIYHDRMRSLLLFIGDPKQAIYRFRGADIFTYIEAKSSVDHQFTMLTNWRSTPSMVQAVNSLFKLRDNPFIFKQIPFITMKSAANNCQKAFYIDDQPINALYGYLLPEAIISSHDYLDYSAEYCAQQISEWLSADSYFSDGFSKNKLRSSDIAILVRTGREANIIQQKLKKRQIKSVYVSNHQSVFQSLEARELLRILQAVLMPTNESYIRSALATRLIGASMAEIDSLSFEQSLELVVEEFRHYQTIWLSYGVLVMLRRLMNHRHLAENLLSMDAGERIITNFMHLGELLQEASQELDTPHALIRWLTKQINEPDNNITNHEQRLESDENLINIITIHKSKGLEYPIVFLPFIAQHRESDSLIYHDPKTYAAHYAYELSPEIKQLIEQERLAEDLRLLYVALTRSIYHCSFAIAGLKPTKTGELSLIRSAIGCLLLDPAENNYQALASRLAQLEHSQIITVELPIAVSPLIPQQLELNQLAANTFSRQLDYTWRVTSYSSLQHVSSYREEKPAHLMDDILPSFDIETLSDNVSSNDEQLIMLNNDATHSLFHYDIYHFPKGATVGTLLHECLETTDFTQPNILLMTEQLITKLNLDNHWQQPLNAWFKMVLASPLAPGLSLSQLSLNRRLNELQFYLPIRNTVTAIELDQICKSYDPLSKQCEPLNFVTVQGMLKGFIDMVFEWQGKYYIVDYKSNYLGESANDYSQPAMCQAMCEHRYDLQYQLYTLALHRYLQSRIANYQYQTHFGGVYYLFIRGMTTQDTDHGIFYTKPDSEFITVLDQLFG